MIIFHAGIRDDNFLLWGEVPAEEAEALPVRRRGRKPTAARSVSVLPFDAGAERLTASLAGALANWPLNRESVGAAVAWLPTIQGCPLASSALIAEMPEASAQPAELAAWSVSTLALPTAQAIDLLCACGGRETLAPGVIVGADLSFWAQAMRFAGSLVARQSFLPALELKGSSGGACWEPVYAGADGQRFARLAAAMPHVCRALTKTEAPIPETPPTAVLDAFLKEVVDGLVRTAVTPVGRLSVAGARRKQAPKFESLHDEWLHALRSVEGGMPGTPSELAQLAEQVREWQRPLAHSAATPFRLCFRLEEPEEIGEESGRKGKDKRAAVVTTPAQSEAWYVRYLLQAADDPSLIFPAADVWKAKGQQAALLKRGAFKPREYLLSALGQAAKISPHVERSLRTATPGGAKLDATAAHEFLQERAWALEQAGFGVMLPAWWTRKGTKWKLSARAVVQSPKLQGGGGMSLDEIVKFDWEIALGDEKLTLKELETLARLKSPLVRVRGQWVELNAEEIQAALDFWKKGATGKARVRDIVQMALGAKTAAPGGIEFAGVTARGWIGELLVRLEGREGFAELPAPEGFQGTLRPYQVRGLFVAQLSQAMGTGRVPGRRHGTGQDAADARAHSTRLAG